MKPLPTLWTTLLSALTAGNNGRGSKHLIEYGLIMAQASSTPRHAAWRHEARNGRA